ncbi:MAG: energy-coupling factor transporter transmembrane component T family protein [Christensenellales bacterium]|jgi:energy-coupling factor transport system permease protein
MLRNITLGQYYPTDSPVHRLDPRIKILLTLAYVVLVFLVTNWLGYGFLLLGITLACVLSKVPFPYLLKSLRPLRFILIFTFVLNLLFTGGNEVWLGWWIFRITAEAFNRALFFSLRMVFLVAGTSMLMLTTSPITLTDGLERLLSPLKVFRFPSHELAMMMTIALRFIPTLLDEADKIMKAQMARGADFESGRLFARAKAMVPLMVPLFVSSFRRADELAMAMESRCYHGGAGRTRMRVLRLKWQDLLSVALLAALFAVTILWG